MMTISKLSSSAQAISYYEKDDYYSAESALEGAGGEPGSGQGEWLGQGAASLHLEGAIDRDALKTLLDGTMPNGQQLGRETKQGLEHMPGFDLTFSAPKSVSLLIEAGGDERLDRAHVEAVREAFKWIESNLARYRETFSGETRPVHSGNLIAAAFEHHTSREKDPQRHSHVLVMNATQKSDGGWASLDGRGLYEYQMAAGAIYRAKLAERIQQLGYDVEITHPSGLFEIRAVPEELRERFQERRDQIKDAMAELGLEGARSAERAALMTRKSKEIAPLNELREGWQAKAREQGTDLQQLVEQGRQAGDRTPEGGFRIDKAVIKAVDRLSEPEAVFSHAELLRWSLAASMGRATIKDVEAEISRMERKGELIRTAMKDEELGRSQKDPAKIQPEEEHWSRQAWTTPRAKEQERRILKNLVESKDQVVPIFSAFSLSRKLSSERLTEGQKAAIELIGNTSNRMIGIQGRSGTGKTTMLRTARELMESKGYELRGMAQKADTARQLQGEAGIPSGTIQAHLGRIRKDLMEIREANSATASALRQKYGNQIWVIDEAGQVGLSEMRSLSYAADRLGARMVLVGDTAQTAAISAGKPFGLMLNQGMSHVDMDEIMRQKDPVQLQAIRHLYAGKVAEAVGALSGHFTTIQGKPERLQAIVARWSAQSPAERDNSYVLTAKGQDKFALNDMMRQVLRREGSLDGEVGQTHLRRVMTRRADRIDAAFYDTAPPKAQESSDSKSSQANPGAPTPARPQSPMVVRFQRNLPQLGIEAGQYWTVAGVDKERNIVRLTATIGQDERTVDWNPAKIAGGAKRSVELFRPAETELAPGERIRWTRNAKGVDSQRPAEQLNNGQILTVQSVQEGQMTVRTEAGKDFTIRTDDRGGQHWEHAYATTVYSSQGGTRLRVLVNADSEAGELFNQKAFLVAISRQKETLHLYTDSIKELQKIIERFSGEKTSAVEAMQQFEKQYRTIFGEPPRQRQAEQAPVAESPVRPEPAPQPQRQPQRDREMEL